MKKLALLLSFVTVVAFAVPLNQVNAAGNKLEIVSQDKEKKKEEPKNSSRSGVKKGCCSKKKTVCKEERK